VALGAKVAPATAKLPDEPYQPIWPKLELARESLLPPRPPARAASAPADSAFVALGARMMPDLLATQNVTLAGFRLLDPNGIVIAGRDKVGQSLSHLEEVAEALQGRFSSALRVRISKHEQPSLYSMSRGTGMRVFTAMPVIVHDQVAGVVYASRTPSNVFRYLYDQRAKVALAVLFMIVPTLLIGFLFHRTITAPMRELIERSQRIGKGDRDALAPLKRRGTSEFARLSQSFLDMARRLDTRSNFISTFATHVSHELKSPLTSIHGAAELLRDDVDAPSMDDEDRRKFLDNIIADADRLAKISAACAISPARKIRSRAAPPNCPTPSPACARRSPRWTSAPAVSWIRRCAYRRKTPLSFSPISPTTRCAMAHRRSISTPSGGETC
jgi:hypothetical protein